MAIRRSHKTGDAARRVKSGFIAISQVMAHQVRGRGIHQIPVIDKRRVLQIEMVDARTLTASSPL